MPKWIEDRKNHILAKNPSMPESMAWGLATQQSHALGKSPKNYGTTEGRLKAKAKYDEPKKMTRTANPGHLKTASEDKPRPISDAHLVGGLTVGGAGVGHLLKDVSNVREYMRENKSTFKKALNKAPHTGTGKAALIGAGLGAATSALAVGAKHHHEKQKTAFIDALPTLTGLATGYSPGRSIASEVGGRLAPAGREDRTRSLARNAAVIGAPLGGLAAMALAKKYHLAPQLGKLVEKRFPAGVIAEPAVEQELVHLGVPGAAAIGGSIFGGAATGAAAGGLQSLRGPTEKTGALKPSPMWSSVPSAGGGNSTWKGQAGFTPTGMKTPEQRLQANMSVGKIDPGEGLKPLNIKVAAEEEDTRPGVIPGAGSLARKAGVGLVGSQVAGTGLTVGMLYGMDKERGLPGASDLYQKVKATSPVKVHEGDMPMFHPGWGADKPHIVARSNSPSTLAHEIGHAEIHNSRLGRLVQNKATTIGGKLSPLIGFAGGLATGGSEDETTRNVGMSSGAIAAAPMLAYEAGASVKGYQNLKRLGANPQELARARKILIPAWGTYGALGGAALASGVLGSAAARGLHNVKVKEKLYKEERKQRLQQMQSPEPKIAEVSKQPGEKEDAETGDETEPHGKLAFNMDMADTSGFNENQYSGVMNPPAMVYRSGVPGWREPPVKTAGPPSSGKSKVGFFGGVYSGAPDGYVETVAKLAGLPIEVVREQVKLARPLKQMVSPAEFAETLKTSGALAPAEEIANTVAHERGIQIPSGVVALADDAAILGRRFIGGGKKEEEPQPRLTPKLAMTGVSPQARLNSSMRVGAPKLTGASGPSIAQISKPPGYGRAISGAAKGAHII
jgi:hypothetical protein